MVWSGGSMPSPTPPPPKSISTPPPRITPPIHPPLPRPAPCRARCGTSGMSGMTQLAVPRSSPANPSPSRLYPSRCPTPPHRAAAMHPSAHQLQLPRSVLDIGRLRTAAPAGGRAKQTQTRVPNPAVCGTPPAAKKKRGGGGRVAVGAPGSPLRTAAAGSGRGMCPANSTCPRRLDFECRIAGCRSGGCGATPPRRWAFGEAADGKKGRPTRQERHSSSGGCLSLALPLTCGPVHDCGLDLDEKVKSTTSINPFLVNRFTQVPRN